MDSYRLVNAPSAKEFEGKVTGHLDAGFVPYGEPIIVGDPPWYYQAMTYTKPGTKGNTGDE